MDTITYSITLADGSMLANLMLNGTNYVSKEPVDSAIFENNCSVVKIEDSEGNSKTYYNMELVHIMPIRGEYFIILREISESEIQAKRIAASLNYICSNVSDEDAAKFADIFPVWDSTKTYVVGDRVKFGDKLFKCNTEHTADVDNNSWEPGAYGWTEQT